MIGDGVTDLSSNDSSSGEDDWLNAFCPSDRNPRPAARSACVATRNKLILETLQSSEVQRNILQTHLNKRNRKTGVQTRLNHQPAGLNAPDGRLCQLEMPVISNSVLTKKIEGNSEATANNASGRTRSRQRVVLFNTASTDGRVSPLIRSDFRNSRTSVRHLRSIRDSATIRIGTATKRRTFTAKSRRNGMSISRLHAMPCMSDRIRRGSHVIKTAAKALRRTRRRSLPAWPRRTKSRCSEATRAFEAMMTMKKIDIAAIEARLT